MIDIQAKNLIKTDIKVETFISLFLVSGLKYKVL